MGKAELVLTDMYGDSHTHSFELRDYDWGIKSVNSSEQNASFFDAWSTALKPLLDTGMHIVALRWVNDIGAIVAEYIPAVPVVGTNSNSQASDSATIGIGYSSVAAGSGGRSYHATSHVKLGHNVYLLPGQKRISVTQFSEIQAYLTWLNSAMPVAVKNDTVAHFKNYYTTQYNSRYQRSYGS